jgi:hypothetical protein
MKDKTHIIVGGGIAAVQLATILYVKGFDPLVLGGTRVPATTKAAGLINPVTGRSYSRSWNIDTLIDHLIPAYRLMEDLYKGKYLLDLEIRRVLNSIQEENKWYSRLQDDRYDRYLDPEFSTTSEACGLMSGGPVVRMKEAYRIDLRSLLNDAEAYFSKKQMWVNADFIGDKWDPVKGHYDGQAYQHITFCRGGYEEGQPFHGLKIIPNLGEVLFIRFLDTVERNYAIKQKMFIVPFGGDIYWVGGTYTKLQSIGEAEPDFERIENALRDMLDVPYEIVDRTWGIRPTTPDRRPMIGTHPGYPNVSILNGLGTKGSSLSPYSANLLFDHIYNDGVIPDDMRWDRF